MPRFRTGHRVALNVYDGDEPVFQAHDPASALRLVGLLNMGWHLTQVTYDQLQNVFAESERYWGEEDFLGRLRADVWMLLMPKDVVVGAPDAPPSAHESPSEPPAATGQPEDKLVDLMAELERSVADAKASRARKRAADVEDGS